MNLLTSTAERSDTWTTGSRTLRTIWSGNAVSVGYISMTNPMLPFNQARPMGGFATKDR
jgi:hypothetical protein